MRLEADVETSVEFVQLLHVGVPSAVQELVLVVEIEHMHAAADEAGEVGGPDEFVLALFLEVDDHGDVIIVES